MTQPPDHFHDKRLQRIRQWRRSPAEEHPISWRERAEEIYREVLYRFWRETDKGEREDTHPGAWAQKTYPELFDYWKQCERNALRQTQPREPPPLDQLVIDTQYRHSDKQRRDVNTDLFLDWVRSQSDSEDAQALLEQEEWSGLFEVLVSELPCPDMDFVEALFEATATNKLTLWNALIDNPALEAPAARRVGEYITQRIVERTWRNRHRQNMEGDVLVQIYEQGFELPRSAIEQLLQAACQIDENTYMFDAEHEQASQPENRRADQALERLARYLDRDDLLRIIQSYRENDWAAQELLKREDPGLETLRGLALYCGSYDVRKKLLNYDQLLIDDQARASLNESHGQEVQLALLRTARGEELRRRFVEMLEEAPQTTLEYLRNHDLTAPGDLDPQMLMPVLKGTDRQTRREAILLASKIHPEAEPARKRNR